MKPHALARGLVRNLTPDGFTETPYQWGVVNVLHTSPNSVDCYLDGSTTLTTGIRYMDSYTPTVGDTVVLCRHTTQAGQDRWVLGKLA